MQCDLDPFLQDVFARLIQFANSVEQFFNPKLDFTRVSREGGQSDSRHELVLVNFVFVWTHVSHGNLALLSGVPGLVPNVHKVRRLNLQTSTSGPSEGYGGLLRIAKDTVIVSNLGGFATRTA